MNLLQNRRLERTLRRLLALLDLSRDVERSRDDVSFAQEDGEIIYVFDENIFEMFVHPNEYSEAVETFYANVWLPGKNTQGPRPDPAQWQAFEIQSALIASESMLGQSLPGAKSDHLYLTDPHRFELARRVGELAREGSGGVSGAASIQLTKKLKILAEFSEAKTDVAERSVLRVDERTEALSDDIRALRAGGADHDALNQFRLARLAAKELASDEVLEPVEQLKRLSGIAFRTRLKSLHTLYGLRPGEIGQIESHAERWYKRLLAELTFPAHAHRKRDDRALWNDALALAATLWAARRAAREKKRLVLVTGDPLLFDAYRRAHASAQPGTPEFFEPFVLRRARQYAPIFTAINASDGIGEDKPAPLAQLLRESLEAALVGLSISNLTLTPATYDVTVARARERMALKAVEREELITDPDFESIVHRMSDNDWLERFETRIRDMRQRWQNAQRAAIGSSYEMLSRRLNPEEIKLARTVAGKGAAEAVYVIQQYITGLLDEIISNGLKLWLPLAAESISARHPFRINERPRAPLTVQLELPSGLTLAQFVESWWRGAEDAPAVASALFVDQDAELVRRPDLVFAIAAALALAVQEANEAERFAGLAVEVADRQAETEGNLRTRIELTLLHALTIRFQMAATGGRPKSSGREDADAAQERFLQITTAYSKALIALDRYEGLLVGDAESEQSNWAKLLRIRAYSERSGLCLFMGTARLIAGVEKPHELANARRHVREAKDAIKACFRLERSLEGYSDDLLRRVRRQFVPNVAAAEVLSALLVGTADYVFDESLRPYIREVQKLVDLLPNPPLLLKAEYLAFRCLAGKAPADADKEFAQIRRRVNSTPRLPMDRDLLVLILKDFQT